MKLFPSRIWLQLPTPYSQAGLTAFGIAAGLTMLAVSLPIALWIASPSGWVLGLTPPAILIAIGGVWPTGLAWAYTSWNRLATWFAGWARVWVLAVCFYAIISLVGRLGSRLIVRRLPEDQSLWEPSTTLAFNAYHSLDCRPANDSTRRSWPGTYGRWALRSRNFWSVSLIPFLILLWALDTEQESELPTNIYTLY